MKKSYINKVSKKQASKLRLWAKVKARRMADLEKAYGCVICEYCGQSRNVGELWQFDPHHIDHNRNNNTYENCYIVHRCHHSYIHDHNIRVSSEDFGSRELFL